MILFAALPEPLEWGLVDVPEEPGATPVAAAGADVVRMLPGFLQHLILSLNLKNLQMVPELLDSRVIQGEPPHLLGVRVHMEQAMLRPIARDPRRGQVAPLARCWCLVTAVSQ